MMMLALSLSIGTIFLLILTPQSSSYTVSTKVNTYRSSVSYSSTVATSRFRLFGELTKRLRQKKKFGSGSVKNPTLKSNSEKKPISDSKEATTVDKHTVESKECVESTAAVNSVIVAPAEATNSSSSQQQTILSVLNKTVETFSPALCIKDTEWFRDRLEVTVATVVEGENGFSPTIDDISKFHRSVYDQLEADPVMNAFLAEFEIMMASPGLSDVLSTDRDFVSFKGFNVIVKTSEIFKKKDKFEGSLVSRCEEAVSISVKGRIVKVPRSIIAEVRLPPARHEEGDDEVFKLR